MMTQWIRTEDDIFQAVNRIVYILKDFPFTEREVQSVIVSLMEITRNVLDHGGGEGHFACEQVEGGIRFVVTDRGPGICNVGAVLAGEFESVSGLGLGLSGAKRLMDELHIETSPKGTKISAIKRYS